MRSLRTSVLVCVIASFSPMNLAAGSTTSTAPVFELVTFAGEIYNNESLKGQPALLAFWAPWCKVCQQDLPPLAEFYLRDRPAQLRVVSIGFADTRTNVVHFVKERSGTFVFPTAYDEDRWTSQAFKINATPTYVLLGSEGSIVLVHRGGGVFQNVQFQKFLSALKGEDRVRSQSPPREPALLMVSVGRTKPVSSCQPVITPAAPPCLRPGQAGIDRRSSVPRLAADRWRG